MSAAPARDRLRSDLHRLLSILLRRDVDDPRLQGVTITRVELGRGNETIHVWVHAMEEGNGEEVTARLQRLAGYLRHALGRSLRRRRIGDLRFHWDHPFAAGNEIVALLGRMERGER